MSAAEFNALTSALDYPMFVVTCASGSDRAGCLVGFATQCSIEPPRYLVCISQRNHTARVANRVDVLAVHLVASHQRDLAGAVRVAHGRRRRQAAAVPLGAGFSGVPLLADCPNRFLGRVVDRFPVGDHTGYLLDVMDASAALDVAAGGFEPLTFQQVRDVEPGQRA